MAPQEGNVAFKRVSTIATLSSLSLFRWIMYACPGHYHTPWVATPYEARATAPIVFPFRLCNELLGRLLCCRRRTRRFPCFFTLQTPISGLRIFRTNALSPLHLLPPPLPFLSFPLLVTLFFNVDRVGGYSCWGWGIDSGGRNKKKKVGR